MKKDNKKLPSPIKKIEAPKLSKKHRQEKLKNALILLDEVMKIKLAPSQIHGVGVFAMRDLKKGEKIYADSIPHQFDIPYKRLFKLKPEIIRTILEQFPLVLEGSHFLYPTVRFMAYMNHSDTPNYNGKEDKVTCDIKAGEEITEDYRLIDNYKSIFLWLNK